MVICQVLASRGNGGLEKHVHDLSIALVAAGHRVLVIADPIFLKTLPDQIEKKSLNMRLGRYHPWLLFQLWKTLKCYPLDVIHAQANKAASLVSAVSWALKTPTVATIHNYKKHTSVFSRFNYVICVSKYLASLVRANNVDVIYNGIPQVLDDANSNQKTSNNHDKPFICAVGRLVSAKGFDVLLEAIDGLPLKLVIAGEGPLRKSLENRILRMHALTEVSLIGHSEDVIGLIKASDGLIISSRREGFSYVFIEALMNNCNIISTDVAGAQDILPNDLLVPINNPQALRAKIEAYVFQKSAWQLRMEPAQSLAKSQLTLTQMVSKTLAIYKKMRTTK